MNRFAPAAALACGAILAAGFVHTENAVYSCVDARGVKTLTNVPSGGKCTQLFSYQAPPPVPATPAAPAAGAAASVAPAGSARAGGAVPAVAASPAERPNRKAALVNGQPPTALPRSPLEERLAQRRDDAIEQTRAAYASDTPLTGMNRAVNRRYLMTNRAAYQKAIGVMQD